MASRLRAILGTVARSSRRACRTQRSGGARGQTAAAVPMNSITLVRRIKARPSIVFEALTTAEGVAAWWGPDELPVVRAEVDARVDGAYLVRFRTLDGREHVSYGTFLELVPPRRIVMTYQYALGGEADERGRTSRIKFELVAVAGGTELTFTHTELAG